MAWIMFPQNLCVEILSSKVTVFGDQAFRKQLKLNEGTWVESLSDSITL